MNSLEKAKKLLAEGGYTCVLCGGDKEYTSHERGVKPLLDLLERKTELRGFSAADRVVGKAAAFLYVLLGVKEVHAGVISVPAAGVLERFHIAATWEEQVDAIVNRTKTGFCPMESAVWNVEEPEAARKAIEEKLLALKE